METKKLNRETVVALSNILTNANISKLERSELMKLARKNIELDKLAKEAQEGIEALRKSFITDRIQELEAKEEKGDADKKELSTLHAEFFSKLNEAAKKYFEEETSFEGGFLSEDSILAIHENNELTLAQFSVLLKLCVAHA